MADAPARIDDCWNRIGIRGDASCLELKQYVHCRNCPVYADAAARLLDAPSPEGYLSQWTDLYARAKADAGHDRDGLSLFLFRVETEWLALPAGAVREVASLRAVHSLPRRGDGAGAVLGLVNVRGKLLACVSLGRVLGLDRAPELPARVQGQARDGERLETRRLLVIDVPGGPLSFPVEEVHGILHSPAGALQEVPATVAGAAATYIRSVLPWKGHSVGCLDGPLLFGALNRSLA